MLHVALRQVCVINDIVRGGMKFHHRGLENLGFGYFAGRQREALLLFLVRAENRQL
jgi:hypothetical protein